MNRENVLFAVIGLLFGLIIGFFFANSINQSSVTPATVTTVQPSGSSAAHPSIPGENGTGSVAEVTAAIERARQNPQDFEAQLKAADLFSQIQRYDGALDFLNRANAIRPDSYEVIVSLGNTSFDAGKYDEAEKWYISALQKKPDALDVRADMGLTYIFREKPDFEKAIKEFAIVQKSEPNNVRALQNMAVTYTKMGERAKAQEALSRLEKADPSNTSIAKLRDDIAKMQ